MKVSDEDADREQGESDQEDQDEQQTAEPSFQVARRANQLILNTWADVPSATKPRIATHYRYKRGNEPSWAEGGKLFPLWNAQARDDFPKARRGSNRVIFYKKLSDDSYQSVPIQAVGGSALDVFVNFDEPTAKQKQAVDVGGIPPATAQWAPSQIQELIGVMVESLIKTTKLARAPMKMVMGQVKREEKRTKRERDLRLGLRKRYMDLLGRSGGVYSALGDHIRDNPEIVNAVLMAIGQKTIPSLLGGDDDSSKSIGKPRRAVDEDDEPIRPARAATVAPGGPIRTRPRSEQSEAPKADDRVSPRPKDTRPAGDARKSRVDVDVITIQSARVESSISPRTPVDAEVDQERAADDMAPSDKNTQPDSPPS